jgi:lipopolysaccharide/colanic/teichoic acid biosynthesis glycosyltransferase
VGYWLRVLRIDELPQIWNVLSGKMSLIGPRPERPEFDVKLKEAIPYYEMRYLVKPGITGWAQVLYPYGASLEDAYEKLAYDLYYIKNYSLWLDILIVLKTIRVVLLGKGR